jgi:hypothetical protein
MKLFESDEMALKLEKDYFKPGDTIKGIINLSLKKPIKARKLNVALIGKVKTTYRDSDGCCQTKDETIYEYALELDGQKEYQIQQYPFEIEIQPDILDAKSSGQELAAGLRNTLGAIGSFLDEVAPLPKPRWFVKANLDIPLKIDINKTQDIIISQPNICQSGRI